MAQPKPTRRRAPAAPARAAKPARVQASAPPAPAAPAHVAILGMGPSLATYVEITKRLGGRSAYCDQTWGINALGDVFACDRVFHMDDVRVQEIRAAANPAGNIAALLPWLKRHPGPVVTSRAHADYPGLVEFPLQEVVNRFGHAYFNNTAAYAVAYAVHIGVKKLSLFGMDFTYPDAHHAEKGRACVEFWLGIAVANGLDIRIPQSSTLMDALTPGERLYGYDAVDVSWARKGAATTGPLHAKFTAKPLPTAEQIEHRYDHNRHPSALVDSETKPAK